MQIDSAFEGLDPAVPTVLTIGKFDGVHRGHQQIVAHLVERARELGGRSAVLTFDPHPDEVLRPEREIRYLTTIEERVALLRELGIDDVIVLPFTAALSQYSAADFMGMVCERIALRELWVGPDFRLGHRAQGTLPVLEALGAELGYRLCPIPALLAGEEPVRSTSIRALLEAGDVRRAGELLGRPFSVRGVVVGGDQRGRTIGFPTANLAVGERHMVPANGVYACTVVLLGGGIVYNAVTNIGVRPTFGELGRTIEAHLFDFSGDLYGQRLQLNIIERLRGEQRFASIQDLIDQIRRDADQARQLLDTPEAV